MHVTASLKLLLDAGCNLNLLNGLDDNVFTVAAR